MAQNNGQASRLALVQTFLTVSLLLFLALFLFPIVLSSTARSALSGMVILVILFVFPGYLLLSLLAKYDEPFQILLSPVVGIVSVTTGYNVAASAAIDPYYPFFVAAVSAAGATLFVVHAKKSFPLKESHSNGYTAFLAGCAVTLAVAPLYWRSGRFSDGEFVFYGPAGQDPLFHVTLLQRLLHHVPPDNFIFAGLRAPVYHYFDDLALALALRAQSVLHLGATQVFDLYFRCYPTFLYFLLGALAYRAGKQLLGTEKGGFLGVLLLLGGGGLGWFIGILQTAFHALHPATMPEVAFSSWTTWDGVDAILPVVHRPAHYHGLLICLAAINVLLRHERAKRDWMVAGLLLGLMAGFNFTLAVSFGIAAVLGGSMLYLQRQRDAARDLAWFAFFLLIGSVPVTAAMLFSGFHNPAAGFPFRGPNLEFSTALWGGLLGRFVPASAVPLAALILFPVFAYGVKLFGLGRMLRFDMGHERLRGIAMVLAIVFVFSFGIGTFFPYKALGGIGVIFIQPTLWILGLFSLRPINFWLERNRGRLLPAVLWSVLAVTWLQALASFNFSHKVAFDHETAVVLREIARTASPDEVMAYLPSSLTARGIWGPPSEATNFALTAMTGLDGYFSSEVYSTSFAVPGLSGRNTEEVLSQAKRLYEQRRDDIEAFVKGDINPEAHARLLRDHVCWIVVYGSALQQVSSTATPWRRTWEIAVYKLSK